MTYTKFDTEKCTEIFGSHSELELALTEVAESRGIRCEEIERQCPDCFTVYIGSECPECRERNRLARSVEEQLARTRAAIARWNEAHPDKPITTVIERWNKKHPDKPITTKKGEI
jgi:hypothetical protein